jgi:hypothetical protein
MTAARVTRGAISFSKSNNFPFSPYSLEEKPVVLPPGRARLSTRPLPTGSGATANTIGTVPARPPQGPCGSTVAGNNHIGRERDQFRRVFAILLGIVPAPAIVDRQIAALTQFPQRLLERCLIRLPYRIIHRGQHQHADTPHSLALLPARRKRPKHGRRDRGAAEKGDEFAPSHGALPSCFIARRSI